MVARSSLTVVCPRPSPETDGSVFPCFPPDLATQATSRNDAMASDPHRRSPPRDGSGRNGAPRPYPQTRPRQPPLPTHTASKPRHRTCSMRPQPRPVQFSVSPVKHHEFRKRSECEDSFNYVGSSSSRIHSSSKQDLSCRCR